MPRAIKTEDYMEERAERGSRRKFDAVLAKVADVPPDVNDELPATTSARGKTRRA
jgi:hypothetical protein